MPRFPHCPGPLALTAQQSLVRPMISSSLTERSPELANIYTRVRDSGVPNYRGARLPVPHGLNINAWRRYEHLLEDRSIVDMLEYGFPIGFVGDAPPLGGLANHSSATANPNSITSYLRTEMQHEAIIGPFDDPPFHPWFRTNPAMTRPKRDSTDLRSHFRPLIPG